MFETNQQPGCVVASAPVFGRFVAQIVLVPLPTMLLAAVVCDWMFTHGASIGDLPASYEYAGDCAIVAMFIGAILGIICGLVSSSLIATGRLIWVLPVIFFALEATPYLSGTSMYHYWFPEYLFSSGDNEGLAVLFCTLPAASSTGYSAGLCVANRIRVIRAKALNPVTTSG